MRIQLLHYSAPPVVGGVESVIGQHARLISRDPDGHQVSILAGRGEQTDPAVPFINLPRVDSRHPEVLAVKAELDAGVLTDRFHSLVGAVEHDLSKFIFNTDVLIAHNVCSLNKNLALTVALKKLYSQPGAPRLILWHHDLAWATPRYQAELHPGYPWDLLRRDWPGAVQVTISRMRQQELASLYGVSPERINIVSNGVDPARFLKLEEQTCKFLGELNLLAGNPLLLLPVRVTPRKNIELALQTLASLRALFPAAKLVVTGPLGPHNPANLEYFSRLLALRSELGLDRAAIFLAEHTEEYLPDEVIADFYRLADALLLPSREEGFGIPVLEAGLAGLPAFCSDIPPLRELGEGFASFFSMEASPDQVAKLITDRLSGEPGFGLRQRVKQEYAWEHIYAEWIRPLLVNTFSQST